MSALPADVDDAETRAEIRAQVAQAVIAFMGIYERRSSDPSQLAR